MGSLIIIEHLDDCAVVRLNRPEKKNAMNRLARRELLAALLSLRDRRAIILTGAGDSFCSGVDLKEVKTDADAEVPPDPRSDWIDVLLAIREHPAVFIAAVNGFALGGGATLISVCDLAIAADEAEIGMPEIGLVSIRNSRAPVRRCSLRQSAPPGSSSRPNVSIGERPRRGGWSIAPSRVPS